MVQWGYFTLGEEMKRFFRKGDRTSGVMVIQRHLKSRLFYTASIDGDYGPMTEKAVMEFQFKKNLHVDGVVGPITLRALGILEDSLPPEPTLQIPNGISQIQSTFGDPLEPGYWKEYSGFCATPEELNHCFTYEFEGKHGFWCNKLLIPRFQSVFAEIVRQYLSCKLYSFDGCFNIRYIRGIKKLSTHSWGISVDLNADTNRLGHEPQMDIGVVKAFETFGFIWGGRFRRKDGMHFQFATNY